MSVSPEKASWAKHADFMAIDLVLLAGSFALAYWLKFGDLGFVASGPWKGLLAFLLVANLAITLLTEPYSGVLRRGYWADIGAYLRLAVASFLVACVVFYLLKIGEEYSREMLITTYLVYLASTLVVKAIWKKFLLSRSSSRPKDSYVNVVAVTTVEGAGDVEQLVSADDMGAYNLVGFCLVDDERDETEIDGKPAVVQSGLVRLAATTHADVVLVAVDPGYLDRELYEELAEEGLTVSFAIAEALGVDAETRDVGNVGVYKTLDLSRYAFGDRQLLYLPIKRVCDVAFGIVGCVLTAIVGLCVKVAYVASGDDRPIMYRQRRVGLRGREFDLWKFRSMVWDADAALVELLKDPEFKAEWERDQKLEDDPRITGVGRFLRKTSLDEFPQFWNVLKGDMSVVGPRPLVPGELEEHDGRQLYNKVKPGITGWWGCNGRSNIEYRERLELEYHYVKHCSLYLDVLCVLRTFSAVLRRDGAR